METNSNVHKLVHSTRRPRSQYALRKASRRELALTRQQTISALVLGAVAVVLTALSLTHLANGIAIVTQLLPGSAGHSVSVSTKASLRSSSRR